MLDWNRLRREPEFFEASWARRNFQFERERFEKLDHNHRALQRSLDSLLTRKNQLAQQQAKNGALDPSLREEATVLKARFEPLKLEVQAAYQALRDFLLQCPNRVLDSVPDGKDESQNVTLRHYGAHLEKPWPPKSHEDLARAWGSWGAEEAAQISGSRFTYLYGPLATLHRALGRWMADHHLQRGYLEIKVPEMVRAQSLEGSGQLPKFKADLFAVAGDEEGRYLIPTAEVPLVNLARERCFEMHHLPLKWMALSSCFRSEVGSYGRDTRGFLRQHQFEKVELVQITSPENSEQALESMTLDACSILEALGVPYRVVVLCAGDLGFSAAKTYDLEVWMAGQGKYREISSCSNCLDFQSRRIKATAQLLGPGRKKDFVHTLNGSGVAVGRALAAVCEYFQTETGNVAVPEVLQPYMGGRKMLWQREEKAWWGGLPVLPTQGEGDVNE